MPAARQGAKRAARGPRFGRRAATHFFLAVSRAQTPVAVEPTLLQARVQAGAPNAINALANALANGAATGAGLAENLAEAVRLYELAAGPVRWQRRTPTASACNWRLGRMGLRQGEKG